MEINDMAGHLVRRLHQHSTQVFQARMKAEGLDLTSVQFAAMGAVLDAPGIDQAGVAAAIAYDRATIGGVIERLVQKGYLRREISKTDRRARALWLTDAGLALQQRVGPIVEALQADILHGLSEVETATFLALARKVLTPADAPAPGAAPADAPASDRTTPG